MSAVRLVDPGAALESPLRARESIRSHSGEMRRPSVLAPKKDAYGRLSVAEEVHALAGSPVHRRERQLGPRRTIPTPCRAGSAGRTHESIRKSHLESQVRHANLRLHDLSVVASDGYWIGLFCARPNSPLERVVGAPGDPGDAWILGIDLRWRAHVYVRVVTRAEEHTDELIPLTHRCWQSPHTRLDRAELFRLQPVLPADRAAEPLRHEAGNASPAGMRREEVHGHPGPCPPELLDRLFEQQEVRGVGPPRSLGVSQPGVHARTVRPPVSPRQPFLSPNPDAACALTNRLALSARQSVHVHERSPTRAGEDDDGRSDPGN